MNLRASARIVAILSLFVGAGVLGGLLARTLDSASLAPAARTTSTRVPSPIALANTASTATRSTTATATPSAAATATATPSVAATATATPSAATTATATPSAATTATATPSAATTATSAPESIMPGTIVTHTIAEGDLLSFLAIRYNTTVDEILTLNPSITNPDTLALGQIIRIRSGTP